MNEETVYSSDEDFDYTFMVITSVMQTPKDCFREPEPLNELPDPESMESLPKPHTKNQFDLLKTKCEICFLERSTKNMRRHMLLVHNIIPEEYLNEMEPMNELTELESVDLDLSENIPLVRSISPSVSDICEPVDPTKAICQICGREKSAKNMRRHMQLVHKTEIEAEFRANIKSRLVRKIEIEPIIDQLPGDMVLDDPLDFSVPNEDDSTNIKTEVESNFVSVPQIFDEESNVCIKEEPFAAELLLEDDISLENSISFKIHQSDLKASHEKCPICLNTSNITNIRRHLIYAHKLSESEIKEISLHFCSRCLVCQKLMYTRIIKKHFFEVHNITDDAEIDRLNVNYWAKTSVSKLRQNKTTKHTRRTLHPVDMNPEPITSFEVFYPTKQSTTTQKPKANKKVSSEIPPLKAELPPLKPFQCRCPLCFKAGHHTNIKRHLKLVHKLSKYQISETLKLINTNELPNRKPTTVRMPLKCTICAFETSTTMFMRLHNKSKHNSMELVNFKVNKSNKSESVVEIKCKVCYFTTTSPSEMQQHNILAHTTPISLHEPQSSFTDTFKIEQIFSEESVIQSEINSSVPNLKPSYFRCPICLKEGHQTNIKRHLRLVHKLTKLQIIEVIKLIDKRSLTRLVNPAAGSLKHKQKHSSFECYICKHQCRGENSLRQHYNAEHLSGKDSKTPVSLIERERRKRNCTCAFCKTEFSSRLLVLTHLTDDHSGAINEMIDERFDCDVCSRVLDSFSEYELHQHRVHIYKREQTPHLCNICGKYQQSNLALKMHLNTHTNTRQHVCNVCNKTFTAKTTLSEHMLVHTGEKRYICSLDGCNAAYAQRSGLTQHKILRHLENRHQCEFCGQKFPLLRYLK